MTFEEKIKIYEQVMTSKGEKKSSITPPLYWLFWKLGLEVPPPVFGSFIQNMLIQGSFFAVAWGAIMWFTMWRQQGTGIHVAIGAAVLAGILFGAAMAFFLRRKNKKLGLGAFDKFPGRDFRAEVGGH